jgi:Tfp pilus assembly protein PilO
MPLNLSNQHNQYKRYFGNLNKISLSKKTKTYSGIVFTLLAITFFAIFAIKPTLIIISQLIKETKDQKEVNKVLEEKINDLSKAQSQYSKISKDLYLVDQSLPLKPEASLLIKELEVLAYYSSVELVSFKVNQTFVNASQEQLNSEKTAENTGTIYFSITASGNYDSLKTFLKSLDNLRRIILVDSFSFKSNTLENEKLTLTLNAKAYYQSLK